MSPRTLSFFAALLLTAAMVASGVRVAEKRGKRATGKWVFSDPKKWSQTCSDACDATPGGVCVADKLTEHNVEVNDADKARRVFAQAGTNCSTMNLGDPSVTPYFIDYGAFGLDCYYSTSGAGDCTAFGRRADQVRLCWCESGVGPSPTPAPVKECTWNVDCPALDCHGPHDMCLRIQGDDTGNSGCRINRAIIRGTCDIAVVETGACCYYGPLKPLPR